MSELEQILPICPIQAFSRHILYEFSLMNSADAAHITIVLAKRFDLMFKHCVLTEPLCRSLEPSPRSFHQRTGYSPLNTSVLNGSRMDNQANFVEDASRDNSRIANSRRPIISTDMYTPSAVANERPSDVQASSIIRMPSYSHAIPVLKDTETTQHFSPNVQPLSSPAATRHNPTPRAVTAGHSITPNVPIGRQDHLANAHTPAKSSRAEYARSSLPQRSSALSTSAPSQASHNGKRPSATSAAFAVTPSERTHARSGKNVLKRSFDHKNDNHSSHKRSRGPRNGVSNQPIAVQADEREWWDDARFDPPKDRYEMQALQEALAPTIRTFATISGRPSPEVSPCTPYGYQYRFLQRAMLEHWKADRRLGNAPMLAGLCAWPGGIMAWGKARVHTSEEDLVAYKHPSLLVPQIRPGSLLWYQDFAREWFQGDEEDRRRQDTIQTESMQGDFVTWRGVV